VGFATVALLWAVMACAGPDAPRTQSFAYTPDFTSVLANPERGYFENFTGLDYLHGQDFDDDYAEWLTDPEYDSWRFGGGYLEALRELRRDGVTMLDAPVHLNEYIDSRELPQSWLSELSRALGVVREAGMKIVLRMVYSDAWTPLVVEENYLRHIEQIGEVVTENADIVAALCAGILGPWGEWHNDDDHVMVAGVSHEREDRPEYKDHEPTTAIDSPAQGAQRYRLVKQLLEHTPDTVPVLIRYTENLMEIAALANDPPPGSGGLTQVQLDRLGQHDDSFASYVRSHTRGGGWDDPFRPYWDDHKEYDPVEDVAAFSARMGTSFGGDSPQYGETAWYPEDDRDLGMTDPSLNTRLVDAGAQLALSEAAARNLTAINRSWEARHLELWREAMLPASGDDPAESAYGRLDRKLGYRLRLDHAEFTTTAERGDAFSLKMTVFNDGYAGIVRARPVFVVFDDGVNRYDVELTDIDARTWLSGESRIDVSVALPADMAAGEYVVALWLPDYYEGLRGLPEYSVRFANRGIWCGTKGYNYLGTVEYFGDGESVVEPLSREFVAALGDNLDNPREGDDFEPAFDPALITETTP
jgi:hypothetical protein